MFSEFIRALSLIFIAEMGDKTQIIAMTFATQFLVREVLTGVALGVLANHGIAILLGSLLGSMLPLDKIQLFAGALFIFFGLNALKIDEEDHIEKKQIINPIIAVAIAFFVGELGDKTQLSAMALSAEAAYPMIILIGTTAGMIATSGMGIYVGSKLGSKIPEVALKITSSAVFVFFGLQKIITGIYEQGIPLWLLTIASLILVLTWVYLILQYRRRASSRISELPLQKAAHLLYDKTTRIKRTVDDLCLGEGICGECVGSNCLMGYTRDILNKARDKDNYFNIEGMDIEGLLIRDYDRIKVEGAYMMLMDELNDLGWILDERFVLNRVREVFEVLLFNKRIITSSSFADHLDIIKTIDSALYRKINIYIMKEGFDEK